LTAAGSVHGLLEAAAERHGGRVAIRAADATLTYAELDAAARALAGGLGAAGIGRGDRVLILAPNCAASVATLFAASRTGAAFVLVAPSIKPFQLRHILRDAEPAVVFTTPELRATLAETGVDVPVRDLALDRREPAGPAAPTDPTSPDDPVALIYTSGSTSMPKAVVSLQRNVTFAAAAIQERLALRADDVIGCYLPLAFDYGLYQALLACAVGATLALGTMEDVGPGFLRELRGREVTVLPAVPSMVAVLLQLAARRPEGRPALRMVTNTGAHLSPAVIAELRERFPGADVFPMFGLTECKRVSILLPSEVDARPGSVGRPLAGTACWIVDEDGKPVPPGTPGELVVTGPHVMAGYWRAPELSAQRYRHFAEAGERALFTGDRCALDDDGYLYFHGRADDVFKRRGFRVSAAEIEAAALDVDRVLAAAVVLSPVPEPILYVRSSRTPPEISAELRLRLDDYKLPAKVRVVDELPLTPNGKIDKAALRVLEAAR
jgi:amino acid adenylation domain-containing protein